MGAANARPIADSDAANKIWIDDFKVWAAATDAEEFYYDDVIEQRTSVLAMLSSIAAAGRAARSMRDTKHTVVREEDGTTVTQIFTTRNSRNYSFERKFYDPPHGFRIRFASEDADYQQDEIIVYDDGYNAENASKFETLTLSGITNPDQIWRFGRFHIAQARLRQKQHHLEVDFEHLASLRGDLVHVQNDVMLAAIGAARVVRCWGDHVLLDEAFVVENGKSYAGKFRSLGDGALAVIDHALSAQPGTSVKEFVVPEGLDSRIAAGDLMIFGEAATITVPLKITSIEPRAGLSAALTLVDAAPAILTADTGEIPEYSPNITLPPDPTKVVPPTPRILQISSEPNLAVVLPSGHRAARLVVSYDAEAYDGLPLSWVELRLRVKEALSVQPWTVYPRQGIRSGSIATLDVEPGETYEVEIRTVSAFGAASAWSAMAEHTIGDFTVPTPGAEGISVELGPDGIVISLDVTGLDQRDVSRVQIRYGEVDDRDDASTVARYFSVPGNLESLTMLDIALPLSGAARTLYVWARFENVYETVGDWLPLSATGGLEVDYPGQTVTGYLSAATNGIHFVQASDGTWNAAQTDLTFTWLRAGVAIAMRTIRVTRTDATVAAALLSSTGEATSDSVTGGGTSALSISAEHTNSSIPVLAVVTAVESGPQGPAGTDGTPGADGADGADGQTSFFHVAYADSADGATNFNQTSGQYIGTYVDFTASDSSNPSDYHWVLFKGAQGADGTDGIAGTNGEDGSTSYLHLKYSNDGGATFTGSSGEAPGTWIGQYVDFVLADSNDPEDYTWAKIQGPGSGIVNGDFEDGDVGWTKGTGWTIVQDPANARLESWCAKKTGASGFTRLADIKRIQVNPGDRVLAQGFGKRTSGSSNISVGVNWYNAAGTLLSSDFGNSVTSSSYAQSRVIATAPASAASAEFAFDAGSGTYYGDGAYMAVVQKDADIDATATTNGPAEAGADATAGKYSLSDWGPTQTFIPTWTGFSSAPSGMIQYSISTDGRWAKLFWTEDQSGTSSGSAGMSITNLPSAIRPGGPGSHCHVVGTGVFINGTSSDDAAGGAWVWTSVSTNPGTIEFAVLDPGGVSGALNRALFTISGAKGIRKGMQIMWAL